MKLLKTRAFTSSRRSDPNYAVRSAAVCSKAENIFSDKTPFTTLEQQPSTAVVAATGKRWWVCYSERLGSESAEFAGTLVKDGIIGDVISVLGLAHRSMPWPP